MSLFFDIRTLSVVMGATVFALALSMVYYTVSRKTYSGFGAWTMGTILVSLGFFLIAFRHVLSSFFTIVVANAVIYSALALFFLGFKSIAEKKVKWYLHFAVVFLLSFVLVPFFTYVSPSVNTRISLISFAAALYFFFSTLVLVKDIQYVLVKLNKLLTITLILLFIFFAFRGIFFLLPANTINDFMSTGVIHGMALLAMIILAVFFVVGVMQLNSQMLERELYRDQGELKKGEERYRRLVEESLQGLVIAQNDPVRLSFVSKPMEAITGYSREDLEKAGPQKLMELIHSEDRESFFRNFNDRLSGKEVSPSYEFRLVNKIKGTRWVELYSSRIEYEGTPATHTVFLDVTDRKLAEEALRQSEQKFHLLFDNAPVGYQSLDENGCFLDVNQAWLDILGYERHEVIGKWFGDFLPLELVEVFKERFKKNIQRHDLIPNVEFPLLKKDGSIAMVDYMARIGRDEEGHFIRTHCAFMDITESRKLEEQLRQSQKMEAVGTLAGGIAHDFNNILAVILGNTELAAFDIPDSNPAAMSLKAIRQASLRAKDMVQQLLAFSRKSDEKSRPFNMTPIIKESMKMLRSAVPTSVAFKQHLSGDLCNVQGDATQIHQIVMNLVTNAAHAMSEEGGLLEVNLENITLQEEKSCFDWVLSPGEYIRLKVRDTGEGIEPTIIDRIFEPYYTTKEVGKGTGMGLSVVHGIVKRHGGGIRVESELGKGTIFEIYFPALEETAEEKKEPEGEIKGGPERILFVDDEESLVGMNHQRLERLGYQVKSTTKPLEALEWFKTEPNQFDVVITDMTMPRMTGDKLAAEVLKIRPHMPVIICTGYSERMSAKKAEGLGVRKYLEKPIGLRNMASALREVLDDGPMSAVPT